MVWLTSIAAVEPAGQEKVIAQEPPAKAVKQEEQGKAGKEKAAAGEKKAVQAKPVLAIPALPLMPAQRVRQGLAAPARRVAVPVPVGLVPPQANGDFLLQQFLPQFQRTQKAELHFMRMVCQPTRQQFEKIAADSAPALKEAAEKYGRANPNARNGIMMVQAGRAARRMKPMGTRN